MKQWKVSKKSDIFFYDAWAAYIASLEESTDQPTSREEWESIIKAEDENHETTEEIISGLLDWLESDGFVKEA